MAKAKSIIVTDNGILARQFHPDARILTTMAEVMALEPGAPVTLRQYAVGQRHEDALTATRTLAGKGMLHVVEDNRPPRLTG